MDFILSNTMLRYMFWFTSYKLANSNMKRMDRIPFLGWYVHPTIKDLCNTYVHRFLKTKIRKILKEIIKTRFDSDYIANLET